MKREEFGYSMPVHGPLYPEPPYYYEAKLVQVIGKAKPEAVIRFVPEPFTPDENYLVTYVVAEYSQVTSPGKPEIGPYNESFILIRVKLAGEVGALCPHMYVNLFIVRMYLNQRLNIVEELMK